MSIADRSKKDSAKDGRNLKRKATELYLPGDSKTTPASMTPTTPEDSFSVKSNTKSQRVLETSESGLDEVQEEEDSALDAMTAAKSIMPSNYVAHEGQKEVTMGSDQVARPGPKKNRSRRLRRIKARSRKAQQAKSDATKTTTVFT